MARKRFFGGAKTRKRENAKTRFRATTDETNDIERVLL